MPGQGRLGDKASIQADAHGCPACPHPAVGPATLGSPDVNVNGRAALRVDDVGRHAPCCAVGLWTAQKGSSTVFINGKAAFRLNDPSTHCGGQGQLIEGSGDVLVGDSSSGGGGGGGGSGSSSGGSGGASGSGGSGGGGASSSGSSSSSSSGGGSSSSSSGSSSSSSGSASGSNSTSTSPAQSDPAGVAEDQIEIQLVNAAGDPRPNVAFELELPDGTKKTGTSDSGGWIRFSQLTQKGQCKLTLPEIDG